jgi:hypothetical protein
MLTLPAWFRPWRKAEAKDSPGPNRVTSTATAPERRQAPRRGGEPVEVFLDDGGSSKPLSAWVRNRSAGGLGISCAQPFAEGTLLNARVTVASAETPWTPLTVRACTPFVTGWMLHCQYVSTPDEEVRLLFR